MVMFPISFLVGGGLVQSYQRWSIVFGKETTLRLQETVLGEIEIGTSELKVAEEGGGR